VPHLLKFNTHAITTKTTILSIFYYNQTVSCLRVADATVTWRRKTDEKRRRKKVIYYENITPHFLGALRSDVANQRKIYLLPPAGTHCVMHNYATTQQCDNADTETGITRMEF
jgi:hypothetical protein